MLKMAPHGGGAGAGGIRKRTLSSDSWLKKSAVASDEERRKSQIDEARRAALLASKLLSSSSVGVYFGGAAGAAAENVGRRVSSRRDANAAVDAKEEGVYGTKLRTSTSKTKSPSLSFLLVEDGGGKDDDNRSVSSDVTADSTKRAIWRGSMLGQREHADQSGSMLLPLPEEEQQRQQQHEGNDAASALDWTSVTAAVTDATMTEASAPSKDRTAKIKQKKKKRTFLRSPTAKLTRRTRTTKKTAGGAETGRIVLRSDDRKASVATPKKPHGKAAAWNRRRRRRSVDDGDATEALVNRTRVATQNAWMCGLCGSAFPSLVSADVHECHCVRSAILLHVHRRRRARSWKATTTNAAALELARPRRPPLSASDSAMLFPTGVVSPPGAKKAPPAPVGSKKDGLLPPGAIPLTDSMKRCIVMTDDALVKITKRSPSTSMSQMEMDAERELAFLHRDRAFYDRLAARSAERARHHRRGGGGRNLKHAAGKGLVSKVQNKLVEAYDLIKDEDGKSDRVDQYTVQGRKGKGKGGEHMDISHDDDTLYVNVVVKNSIQVVNNELERMARMRWETEGSNNGNDAGGGGGEFRFERFRSMAHTHVVRLAGLALASDFTPRRIAVQLSNDLYRLLQPQLQLRGVKIETEIEYRVGPYFVLAVNVLSIDWMLLMDHTHKEVQHRKRRWAQELEQKELEDKENLKRQSKTGKPPEQDSEGDKNGKIRGWKRHLMICPTEAEWIAQCLAWLHQLHWVIATPICTVLFHLFLRSAMRRYILESVTDDIFRYVEKKGMEMELQIKEARTQASFMLAALREMRAGDRKRKEKSAEGAAAEEEKAALLGPLLGAAITEDKGDATLPPGFVLPDNLEFVGLEIDLPVGFRRLRHSLLTSGSAFIKDAFMTEAVKYDNITLGEWSHHSQEIGLPTTPDGVNEQDFIGATSENSYLMPKSAFVKANMCYETVTLTEYNDYCFVLKKQARNPDVPYGNTFIAWTQYIITNTGKDTCRMVCSTEAEFPNGPPMVGRQIKSGMRAGTAELFVQLGETICKYADSYP